MLYNPSYPFNPYGIPVTSNQTYIPSMNQQPPLVSENPPFTTYPSTYFAPMMPPQSIVPSEKTSENSSDQPSQPDPQKELEALSTPPSTQPSTPPSTVPPNPNVFMYYPGSFQNYS